MLANKMCLYKYSLSSTAFKLLNILSPIFPNLSVLAAPCDPFMNEVRITVANISSFVEGFGKGRPLFCQRRRGQTVDRREKPDKSRKENSGGRTFTCRHKEGRTRGAGVREGFGLWHSGSSL